VGFPQQSLFTVLEVAVRWGCTQAQIIDWAIADELDLVAGFPVVKLGDQQASSLMSVAGTEVRPLFRPFGAAAKKVYVEQAKRPGSDEWRHITRPAGGVRMEAADILIRASEVERFESAHGLVRARASSPGAPPRYDWDQFYVALIRRLFNDGMPDSLRALVGEMQEWFIENSPTGDAPDESTIRKRITAVWRELNQQ
jgi:hypothetical protein